jgi:hypothetical protein
MRKLAVAALVAAAVFGLSQCELLNKTVEYSVESVGTPSLTIIYIDVSGEGIEVSTNAPWSESFELFASDRPFVAALRVTNNGPDAIDVAILEDGTEVAGGLGLVQDVDPYDYFSWIE